MRSTQNLMDAARYLSPQLKLLNFFVIPLEELVRCSPIPRYGDGSIIDQKRLLRRHTVWYEPTHRTYKDGFKWTKSPAISRNSQNWKSKRASYEENYWRVIKMSHIIWLIWVTCIFYKTWSSVIYLLFMFTAAVHKFERRTFGIQGVFGKYVRSKFDWVAH